MAATAIGEGETSLTERQEALGEFLLAASDIEIEDAIEKGALSLGDIMDAALGCLERSNQTAETIIAENARFSEAFDKNRRAIDAKQRQLQAELEALVNC